MITLSKKMVTMPEIKDKMVHMMGPETKSLPGGNWVADVGGNGEHTFEGFYIAKP
jgi:hypothetical protein